MTSDESTESALDESTPGRGPLVVAGVVGLALLVALVSLFVGRNVQPSAPTTTLPTTLYPLGTPSVAEPSGFAPPAPSALPCYTLSYVTDFTGGQLPTGWTAFAGVPGGDPGGQFGPHHVFVSGGDLLLATYRDSSYRGRWVTGGLCQCGISHVYGAYFVRSRLTGPGPNEVQLLWPANDHWPPEIDFNETPTSIGTSATVHWSVANHIQQWFSPHTNMLAWHTWGVIWSAHQIIYTLDGHEWGFIASTAEIPKVPMRLDLEQRTMCTTHLQCPQYPTDMQVDWVAEYQPVG